MQVQTIRDLLTIELQILYAVEQRLLIEMPALAKLAFDPQLKDLMEQHIAHTKHQIENLDKVFEKLDINNINRDARTIEGLIADTVKVYDLIRPQNIKDISLAFSTQKIEQYEITSYTKVATLLSHFDEPEASLLLKDNLNEEVDMHTKLISIGDIELRSNIGGRDRT